MKDVIIPMGLIQVDRPKIEHVLDSNLWAIEARMSGKRVLLTRTSSGTVIPTDRRGYFLGKFPRNILDQVSEMGNVIGDEDKLIIDGCLVGDVYCAIDLVNKSVYQERKNLLSYMIALSHLSGGSIAEDAIQDVGYRTHLKRQYLLEWEGDGISTGAVFKRLDSLYHPGEFSASALEYRFQPRRKPE